MEWLFLSNCYHLNNDVSCISTFSPFRYRGYFFDEETGLYYLQSRYYDAEVGMWISPEPNVYAGAFDIGSGLLAYNAYAYCANNPVNCSDPTGEFVLSALIVGAIVGAVIGFAATAYVDYKDDGQVFNGSVDAKSYVANTLVGGVIGGFTGGVGSSTFSLTIPTIQAVMTTTGEAVLVAGTTTVTVAGAEIVAGTAVAGVGVMFMIPKQGPANTKISEGGSFGEYDSNGNLSYRVDTTGRPHFIKSIGKYCLPHIHQFTWRLIDGVWRYVEEVLPYIL